MTRPSAPAGLDVAPMGRREVLARRLASQRIGTGRATPAEVVRQLAAIQAQDHAGGLWAIGVRTGGCTRTDVERSIADGTIVRSWPMRGTLHFVAGEDLRWILGLLGERGIRAAAGRRRQLGIDDGDERIARRVVTGVLEGGVAATRAELFAALEAGGCSATGQRGIHLLQLLAQERLICLGAHRGKQPTFVLLEEWVPAAPEPSREEALARLCLRYLAGHGPATLGDLVWWSGLTITDARSAIASVEDRLARTEIAGEAAWLLASAAGEEAARLPPPALLAPFDEYLLGYRDRSAMLDPARRDLANPGANGIFSPVVVVSGRVAGTWRRTLRPGSVALVLEPFAELTATARQALTARAKAYGRFHALPATVTFAVPLRP